jgi:phospholipid-binding lipoprotein MlaA
MSGSNVEAYFIKLFSFLREVKVVKRLLLNKVTGLTFCLMLQLTGIPLSANANSLIDSPEPGHLGKSMPQFVYEVDGTLLAQTSEITILLEKKISPEDIKKDLKPETPEEKKVSKSEDLESEGSDPENGKNSEVIGQTASALETSPSVEFYEELEDPFGPPKENGFPELKDPFEGYNRFMFNVNENLYEYLMEPVARGWRFVLPEDLRIVIRNAFDNAMAPVKLVSSVVQGDWDKSGRVLGRTLINTTAGLGGMLDVAGQEYGIENVDEDFDQALGHYDVPTGPYIILPFLGPSTARNVSGRVVDSFLSPTIFFSPSFLVGSGITVAETTNDTSFIIEDKEALEESAIDEYESVRDFYHQYREGLLKK